MEMIEKWGRYTFVRQVWFGGIVYAIVIAYRGVDAYALAFALVAAGVVAIAVNTIAILGQNTIGVAVTLSSFAALLAGFCLIGSSVPFAVIFAFIALVCAILAAMLARNEGLTADEPFFIIILSALPVIGTAYSYLIRLTMRRKA
jgi:hypothetical protein